VAFELLYRAHGKLEGSDEALINEQALALLPNFRDLGRSGEDGHDAWKGKDSGAFLTWLKEENDPTFSRPGKGVTPRAVNNVDCVVNANALLAAFARYALAFDKHSEGIQGRYRIHVDERTFGLDRVDKAREKT